MEQKRLELEKLADSLAKALPKPTVVEEQVVLELLRQFVAHGEPVPSATIADALDLSRRQVENIMAVWAGWGNVYFDENHRVIAAWGLGVHQTAHHFQVNGHTLYTWCALDPLYIVDLLGTTARIESTCPVTTNKVSFIVGPDGVKNLTPPDAVISFIVPDGPITTDVRISFCHFVHFFASAEAGSSWISQQEGTFRLLSMAEAVSLVRLANKALFEHVIEANHAGEKRGA
ncbi:MAG: organomercurial lyase [Nitrospiraceae bacterium]